MSTDLKQSRRATRAKLLLGALLATLACSSDASVGCSPSLTCSLRPSRFAPPPVLDAGPSDCNVSQRSCSVADMSTGGKHACVVTDASNLLCWGDDSLGQRGPNAIRGAAPDAGLDAGDYLNGFSRVLDGARQVSAGLEHSCALMIDGTVQCWGHNAEGQVDGSLDRDSVIEPVRVAVSQVKQLAAGALHTCALTDQGVVCWGSTRYAQTGRDPTNTDAAPQLVPGSEGALEVACGVRHCCARQQTQVVCWGELINEAGAPYLTSVPVPIAGLQDALQISAGAGHSCALTAQAVLCWGLNDSGQLGDGTTRSSAAPVNVALLTPGAGHIAAGGGELDGQLVGHSCAIDSASQVLCWGRNAEGQLGRNSSDDRALPQTVQAFHPDMDDVLNDMSRVELGAFFSCALGSRGSVYCWGDNSAQQLGENFDPGRMGRRPVTGDAVRVQRFGRMR